MPCRLFLCLHLVNYGKSRSWHPAQPFSFCPSARASTASCRRKNSIASRFFAFAEVLSTRHSKLKRVNGGGTFGTIVGVAKRVKVQIVRGVLNECNLFYQRLLRPNHAVGLSADLLSLVHRPLFGCVNSGSLWASIGSQQRSGDSGLVSRKTEGRFRGKCQRDVTGAETVKVLNAGTPN